MRHLRPISVLALASALALAPIPDARSAPWTPAQQQAHREISAMMVDALGKSDPALADRAIARADAIFGPASRETERWLGEAARVHRAAKDWTRAEAYARRWLGVVERRDGRTSPFLLDPLLELARALRGRGDAKGAAEVWERAEKVAAGPADKDPARAAALLRTMAGEAHYGLGSAPERERLFARAEGLAAKAGPAIALLIVGAHVALLDPVKDDSRVDALIEQALALAEKAPVIDALGLSDVGTALRVRATALSKAGKDARRAAKRPLGRLLALEERVYGKDSPELIETLTGLVFAFDWSEDATEAEAVARRLLALEEKSAGPDSGQAVSTLRVLASLIGRAKPDEADALHQRVLAWTEKNRGAESYWTIEALSRYAEFRREARRTEGIVAIYERLLALAERHPDDASPALHELGWYCDLPASDRALAPLPEDIRGATASPRDAERLLRRVLTLQERATPKDEEEIETTLRRLHTALVALHRMDDAEAIEDRLLAGQKAPEERAAALLGAALTALTAGRVARGDRYLASYEAAVRAMTVPMKLPSSDPFQGLKDLVMARGEIARAERVVRALLAHVDARGTPEDRARAHESAGSFFDQVGDARQSEAEYAAAESLRGASEPDRIARLAERGESLLRVGDVEGADGAFARAYERAARLARGNEDAPRAAATERSLLARLVATGAVSGSRELPSRLARLQAKLTPDDGDDAVTAARGLELAGDLKAARALLERAAAPRRDGTRPFAATVALTLFLERRGDFAAALTAADAARAAAKSPGPPPPPPTSPGGPDLGPPPPPDVPVGPTMLRRAEAIGARLLARSGHADAARVILASAKESDGTWSEEWWPALVAVGDQAIVDRAVEDRIQHADMGPADGVADPRFFAFLGAWATVSGGASGRAVAPMDRAQDAVDRALAKLALTGNERQNRAMSAMLDSMPLALSLHLTAARDDAGARRLALRTILRSKGRALEAGRAAADALRAHLSDSDKGLLDDLAARRAEMASLSARDSGARELGALRAEADRLELELASRSAEFRAAIELATVERVQARLPERAALVEIARVSPIPIWALEAGADKGLAFLPSPPRYVAYVLPKQGEVGFVDLGPARAIDEQVQRLKDALRSPDADAVAPARALDEALMRPVRGRLHGARHLVISPDGALSFVPFGALVDEEGVFLAGRYAITYATSGRDLLRMGADTRPRSGALVVANPAYGAWKGPRGPTLIGHARFAPLDATEQEGARVAKAIGGTLLTGIAASEGALRAAHGPRVLHVATHGFFFSQRDTAEGLGKHRGLVLEATARGAGLGLPENPLLRTGLALAGANEKSAGIVTGLEASSLDLFGTKLVVLSACETGLGDASGGDGVMGLRRAFQLAGVETLVTSLWKVDDEATRDLMVRYYEGLARGEGRAEALRRAQLEVRKARPHPYYWAAFVPVGDWRTLEGKDDAPSAEGSVDVYRVDRGARGCACDLPGGGGASSSGALAAVMTTLGLASLRRRRRGACARATRPGRSR